MNKMFNRVKEEERIERIIRGLLKLQDNRRCINCNSLGPQYICTTFWTFVCTRCSGVHREFTHRVKSVSMARFSEEEVSSLEAGGNERAKEIYFKAWDPYRNSYPDPSNLLRLREFIKHVYVDRKYTGERGRDKLPVVKTSLKDNYKEMYSPRAGDADSCSSETYIPVRSGDIDLRSNSNIEDRRSPRNYNQGKRSGRERSLPTRFEIVDDRFRDDGTGDVKRYQYHIFSKSESRRGSSSPNSPQIHSIKDILGEKVIPLEIGEKKESPKQSVEVTCESSGNDEKMAKETAAADIGSLIDLETDPQPQQQAQETDPPKETSSASTPPSSADKVSSINLLESLFIDMSTPAVASIEVPAATAATPVATVATCNTTQTAGAFPLVSSSNGPPVASLEITLALPGPNDSTVLPIKNQHSAVSMGINSSNIHQSTASFGVAYGQQNSLQPTGKAEAPLANPSSLQQSQAATMTALNTSPANDPKSIGRKELPVDLFTSSYPPLAAAVPGWQFPPHGMTYGMQYHPAAMAISALPNSAKSRNPFDVGQEGPQVQAPAFPSMLPMQAALPTNVQPQPHPLPYALAMPPQTANYGMTISGGAYVGQQIPNNVSVTKPQGNTSFVKDDSAFASLNPLQQSNDAYSAPATSNSFSSVGGNPFG